MLETISAPTISMPVTIGETPMGKVVVDVQLTNSDDVVLQRNGHKNAAEVRQLTLAMLVDTGATGLALPKDAIQKLGLTVIKEVTSKFANGQTALRKVYGTVQINIMNRSAITWVVESPSNVPALLGQIPLEMLDLMVDPRNQRLVPGHPESPDMAVYEAY